MERNEFLRAYRKYLELYQRYLDRNPRIEEIYISDGRRLETEDSDGGIYRFNISESEFLRLDKMMSSDIKVLIGGQEYEAEILSFDKKSIVIRLNGIRDKKLGRVCLAGDAEFLKRITERQIGILESLHENPRNVNMLFDDFEGAERVSCSFEDARVERNPKQKEAVEFSVGVRDLFLIWGPPGTGKSTIVPEIIRNYLARRSGAKILVCSYANRAVDRIVEIICADENLKQKIVRVGPCQIKAEYKDVKLREIVKSELERINIGIRELRRKLEELKKKKRILLDDEKKKIKEEARERVLALENKIRTSREKIKSLGNRKGDIENEIAQIRDTIARLSREKNILDKQIAPIEKEKEETGINSNLVDIFLGFAESRFSSWSQRRRFRRDPYYISHRSIIEGFNLENRSYDNLRELKNQISRKMRDLEGSLSLKHASLRNVREEINKRNEKVEDKRRELRTVEEEIEAEKRKESELEDEKAKLEDLLSSRETRKIFSLARRLNILAEERIDGFKKIIKGINAEGRVISQETESLERKSDVKDIEKRKLNEKQIIATTNLKLLTSVFDDLHFDLAIMDEAGFTDLPAAFGPFVKADKIILIGDHKQLQPIIQESGDFESHVQQYPFITKSIFELFWEGRDLEKKGIMLNKQYRMKEEIAKFISRQFYNDELGTELHGRESNLWYAGDPVISSEYPLVFINIKAREVKEWNSWFCKGETELVKKIVNKLGELTGDGIYDKIGVITPYRPQSNRLKDELPKEVACGTVHVFQGHEKPIVICSTVRQNEERGRRSPLLRAERLLNVAVSRAMDKFILVGNKDVLYQLPFYRDFIEHAHAERYGKVYEEIPEEYDYQNRCEYCGKPIKKTWELCQDCYEAVKFERDRGKPIRDDGVFVRSRGELPTGDSHWVRSEDERRIDNWLSEHNKTAKHIYEKEPVQKYPFILKDLFERDLNESTVSNSLREYLARKGIHLSDDVAITKKEEETWEITDYNMSERYRIDKEKGELKIYRKARIPMWCDWYLLDCDIYVEYWGIVGDSSYQDRKNQKIQEYERLQLKLLNIEREDLDNLDARLREKLKNLGCKL